VPPVPPVPFCADAGYVAFGGGALGNGAIMIHNNNIAFSRHILLLSIEWNDPDATFLEHNGGVVPTLESESDQWEQFQLGIGNFSRQNSGFLLWLTSQGTEWVWSRPRGDFSVRVITEPLGIVPFGDTFSPPLIGALVKRIELGDDFVINLVNIRQVAFGDRNGFDANYTTENLDMCPKKIGFDNRYAGGIYLRGESHTMTAQMSAPNETPCLPTGPGDVRNGFCLLNKGFSIPLETTGFFNRSGPGVGVINFDGWGNPAFNYRVDELSGGTTLQNWYPIEGDICIMNIWAPGVPAQQGITIINAGYNWAFVQLEVPFDFHVAGSTNVTSSEGVQSDINPSQGIAYWNASGAWQVRFENAAPMPGVIPSQWTSLFVEFNFAAQTYILFPALFSVSQPGVQSGCTDPDNPLIASVS